MRLEYEGKEAERKNIARMYEGEDRVISNNEENNETLKKRGENYD